ncbi:MAG TPA: ATP-binding protein, partial [Ignavibacteriaceae bacterium]|nr:ATP-binding protein [Ignavibacteriaceae bacterium]
NVKLNIKEQDLIKYLGEQIKSFTTPADEKGLTLNFEPKEVKLNAFIDPGMFESIINNLLHNAVKFTQKGKVTLRAMKQENFAVIEVEDTGIGVPKDLQEIIFDPFRQASEGHSRSFEGTGLGLTIVKKYMSLMNGTITLSSKKEDLVAGIAGGSTFVLKLPLTEHIVENVIRTHWV